MWQEWVVRLLLAALTIPSGSRETARERVSLPIEVLGADGTTASRTVTLDEAQSDSVRFLWLQTHGLHYASEASVQVHQSSWIPLNNETVTVSEPGKSYGGIGGGFATLVMTVALPKGTVVAGANTTPFPLQRNRWAGQRLSRFGVELPERRGREGAPAAGVCGG